MVSVIIPVYNEEKTIADCLFSLSQQSYKEMEIIVVDDGSTDKTLQVLSEYQISILKQKHLGAGAARNLGAKKAAGEILVFVDADMTFAKDFIKNLIDPIIKGKSKGTFTKEEYVSNWNNTWARCWNYNEGLSEKKRIPPDYPDNSPVFRAILKLEFDKINGFDNIGFTDDWTLSRKLGFKATRALHAICYHQNPGTLKEVYLQARWIGKNEYISGTFWRRIFNLFRFNPIFQTIRGIFIALKNQELLFLFFQLVYYFGINVSILGAFFGEEKSK